MSCDKFLKNLKDAAVFLSLVAIVDTIAVKAARENNMAVLSAYARITAAFIVASSVKKLIMEEEEEYDDEDEDEVEDEEEHENALEEDSKNK